MKSTDYRISLHPFLTNIFEESAQITCRSSQENLNKTFSCFDSIVAKSSEIFSSIHLRFFFSKFAGVITRLDNQIYALNIIEQPSQQSVINSLFIEEIFKGCGRFEFNDGRKLHMKGMQPVELEYPNGVIYKGSFKNFLPHGMGVLIPANSSEEISEDKFIPEVRFENGMMVSQTFPDGIRYEGKFDGIIPHGKGILIASSNAKKGKETFFTPKVTFKNGVIISRTYENGITYVGEFQGITPHGKGFLVFKSNEKAQLRLDSGYMLLISEGTTKLLGKAKRIDPRFREKLNLILNDTLKEEVRFENGVMFSRTYKNGLTYIGTFDEITPHGKGVIYSSSGKALFKLKCKYGQVVSQKFLDIKGDTLFVGKFKGIFPDGECLVLQKSNESSSYLMCAKYHFANGILVSKSYYMNYSTLKFVGEFDGLTPNGKCVKITIPNENFLINDWSAQSVFEGVFSKGKAILNTVLCDLAITE